MSVIETYYGPDGPETKSKLFDASSFLGFLRRSSPIWHTDPHKVDTQQWVYRGHWDHRWPLVPSAARRIQPNIETQNPHRLKGLIEKYLGEYRNDPNADSYSDTTLLQVAHIEAYCATIRKFILLGNDLGLLNQLVPDEERVIERGLAFLLGEPLPDLGVQHCPFASPFVQTSATFRQDLSLDGQVTALAQHHGIPTFLLDWSENPWVAAFFGTQSPEKHRDQHDMCIWALDLRVTEKRMHACISSGSHMTRINAFRPPKANNNYLSSQSGLLTYVEYSQLDWGSDVLYPSIEEVINSYNRRHFLDAERLHAGLPARYKERHLAEIAANFPEGQCLLRKIVLAKEHLSRLRQLLRIEGITQAHMMPSLDNLAATSIGLALDGLG
jgi:FRG domain